MATLCYWLFYFFWIAAFPSCFFKAVWMQISLWSKQILNTMHKSILYRIQLCFLYFIFAPWIQINFGWFRSKLDGNKDLICGINVDIYSFDSRFYHQKLKCELICTLSLFFLLLKIFTPNLLPHFTSSKIQIIQKKLKIKYGRSPTNKIAQRTKPKEQTALIGK